MKYNSLSVNQKIICILWQQKRHCHIHKSPPPGCTYPGPQTNLVCALTFYYFLIHFNIIVATEASLPHSTRAPRLSLRWATDKSSPRPPFLFLSDPFNIIVSFRSASSKWSLYFRFSFQNSECISFFSLIVPHVPPITFSCVHPTNRLCHTKYEVSPRPCNAITTKVLTVDNSNSNPSLCATD